ncbi:hypothetical protein SLEP1_g59745 [Rubroshorea leprosula]|uniref:Uncharacterized protein n=1 Tax=Rubroshorea leprosula TaxID=152421 RepID=A0AAV5MUS4_9ROSI|nr:hypothetical protein SLEP1_g59745 [Rubroshorea leprosula]
MDLWFDDLVDLAGSSFDDLIVCGSSEHDGEAYALDLHRP